MTHSLLKTRIGLAISASLIAALFCALMLVIVKLHLSSFSTSQITFFRSLLSLLAILVTIGFTKKDTPYLQYLKSHQLSIQLIRSLAALGSVYFFLMASKTASVAEASIGFNTTPLFVPLVAYLWKREPIDHKVWPGFILAFLGIICLMHPETKPVTPGFWLALSGAAIGSVAVVALRLAHHTEPLWRSVFYYSVLSTFITGGMCLVEDNALPSLAHLPTITALIAIGLLGFFFQVLVALSLRYAPTKLIAPFSYASVVFGLLFDFFLWQKSVLPVELLGIGLILCGLYLTVLLVHTKKLQTS